MHHATPYQRHRKKWIDCERCDLCNGRSRVVLARGKLPAPILFIGEAPGASEDVLGKPFVGPAGKLLDTIIERAIDGQHDYAMTNLIACIPKGDDGKKTKEPPEYAIEECAPRVAQFIYLCQPKVIVCVGKLASKWVPKIVSERTPTTYNCVDIIHPAAILRMPVDRKSLAVQRSIVIIEDAIVDL